MNELFLGKTFDEKRNYYQALLNEHTRQRDTIDKVLTYAWINTKLGPMLAIADDKFLYLLEFIDRKGLEREITQLQNRFNARFIKGVTPPLRSITQELELYFSGKLSDFQTPIFLLGTPFQQEVWRMLKTILYGKTWSYAQLAAAIKKPSAFRAVARANGCNRLALIIPCHRVVNANGELGGYGGGLHNKKALLQLERARI